jgi:rare lipoprotein A
MVERLTGPWGCLLSALVATLTFACAPAPAADIGLASFYGSEHAGKRTASGKRFDPAALTAAHPTYPFGSKLRITNLTNGRQVVVEVSDRGPFSRRRIVDVSKAAAQELDFVRQGVAKVKIDPL